MVQRWKEFCADIPGGGGVIAAALAGLIIVAMMVTYQMTGSPIPPLGLPPLASLAPPPDAIAAAMWWLGAAGWLLLAALVTAALIWLVRRIPQATKDYDALMVERNRIAATNGELTRTLAEAEALAEEMAEARRSQAATLTLVQRALAGSEPVEDLITYAGTIRAGYDEVARLREGGKRNAVILVSIMAALAGEQGADEALDEVVARVVRERDEAEAMRNRAREALGLLKQVEEERDEARETVRRFATALGTHRRSDETVLGAVARLLSDLAAARGQLATVQAEAGALREQLTRQQQAPAVPLALAPTSHSTDFAALQALVEEYNATGRASIEAMRATWRAHGGKVGRADYAAFTGLVKALALLSPTGKRPERQRPAADFSVREQATGEGEGGEAVKSSVKEGAVKA